MTRGAAVEFRGLAEFRRELRGIDKAFPKALAKVHRDLARWLQGRTRGAARGEGGMQAKFATQIGARGSAQRAELTVGPRAFGAFLGAKPRTRSGWNAGRAYKGGAPQFPAWVGTSWEVGGPGGPYAINPTIARNVDEIVDHYGRGVEDVARRAFPD